MMLKDVAVQVAGMMLHYATIEKMVAALQEGMLIVELIPTSRNSGWEQQKCCAECL